MTYEDSLRRWIVVRLSPDLRHVDVARFYKYSGAEGYLQILRRTDPGRRYEIMFEAKQGERPNSEYS